MDEASIDDPQGVNWGSVSSQRILWQNRVHVAGGRITDTDGRPLYILSHSGPNFCSLEVIGEIQLKEIQWLWLCPDINSFSIHAESAE